MQIAYVVEDIDLAVKHWAEKVGLRGVALSTQRYKTFISDVKRPK